MLAQHDVATVVKAVGGLALIALVTAVAGSFGFAMAAEVLPAAGLGGALVYVFDRVGTSQKKAKEGADS